MKSSTSLQILAAMVAFAAGSFFVVAPALAGPTWLNNDFRSDGGIQLVGGGAPLGVGSAGISSDAGIGAHIGTGEDTTIGQAVVSGSASITFENGAADWIFQKSISGSNRNFGLYAGSTPVITWNFSTGLMTNANGYSGTTGVFSSTLSSAGYTGTTGVFSSSVSVGSGPGGVPGFSTDAGFDLTAYAGNHRWREQVSSAGLLVLTQENDSTVMTCSNATGLCHFPLGLTSGAGMGPGGSVLWTDNGTTSTFGHRAVNSEYWQGTFYMPSGANWQLLNSVVFWSINPTIASGFGSSPAIQNPNGTAAFTIDVGTGGTASTGTVTLTAVTVGYVCSARDITNNALYVTEQSGGTTTTAVFTNYSRTTGLVTAWAASDKIWVNCTGR